MNKSTNFILSLLFSGLAIFASQPDSTQSTIQQEKINSAQINFGMNNERLGNILLKKASKVEGRSGLWTIEYADRILTIITDETHNRMRIITPIIKKDDIKKKQYDEMLEAMFDRTLDVKYTLYNDVLWAAFIHPLKELTEEQVIDALSQVYFAARTFGNEYISTNLKFGGEKE